MIFWIPANVIEIVMRAQYENKLCYWTNLEKQRRIENLKLEASIHLLQVHTIFLWSMKFVKWGEKTILARLRFGNFNCKKLSKTSLLANNSCMRRFFSSLMTSSGVSSGEGKNFDSRRWENQRRSVFEGECIYWFNEWIAKSTKRTEGYDRNLTSYAILPT